MSEEFQTLDAIHRTKRHFDLFDPAGVEDAEKVVSEMSGESFGSVTPADDKNEESVPLGDALTVTQFSRTKEYQSILGVLRDMQKSFSAKSEDVRATQDARTLYANMALGLKKGIAAVGEHVAAHKNRLKRATTEERTTLPPNVLALTRDAEAVDALMDSPDGWQEGNSPEPIVGWQESDDEPILLDGIKVFKSKETN
jgi:hypothetical protein